ncbi:MAG TPA: VOC family protein [Bryobacteraceae bacterium]|nr:VOC family protein [Bryobacteraceae bacterium]
MRSVTMLLAITLPLGAADLKIDHVTAAGSDLRAMQAKLAAVGIKAEYGGLHNNHATEMALVSFKDGSYLELISIQPNPDPQAVAAHYWSKPMQGNAGPAAWAVRPKDLAAEVERLRAAGITVTAPARAGRDRPDGTHLEWETANTGTEPNGTFFPFQIHDFTPREQRAFPSGKATTDDFGGVGQVVIAVRDLAAGSERYRKAYDLSRPIVESDKSFGAKLASFRGTPVILAAPLDEGSWIAQRLERFGEGPCAFILTDGPQERVYQATQKSHWFGGDVYWLDAESLGWHLGFRAARGRGR